MDPKDWPVIRRLQVDRLELSGQMSVNGVVLEDTTVRSIRTKGTHVALAVLLRRVVVSGPTDALTVRQYGYMGTQIDAVCPAIASASSGGDWVLDLRDMVPRGPIEFTLVVEPSQVLYSRKYSRLISRSGADRLTDEDIASVNSVDEVSAMHLRLARAYKFVRTAVITSVQPDPAWFDYLDSRGLTWPT